MIRPIDLRGRGAIIASAAAVASVLALTSALDAPAGSLRASDRGCANATLPAADATPKQMKRAIVCLIAKKRADRNRKKLRGNTDIGAVAAKHTSIMLSKECFEHRCKGEADLARRIERSGYLKGGGRYGYGENLGCATTPLALMHAWLDSKYHRRNILGKKFRHIGVGVGKGAPKACGRDAGNATYTVIFAWRKR